MATQTNDSKNEWNKLEFLIGQINRLDNSRVSLATRASILISAGAVIITGVTLLLENTIRNALQLKFVLDLSVFITFIFVVLSIAFALNTIISFGKKRYNFVDKKNQPEPLFFHPGITIRHFKKQYQNFSAHFLSTNPEDMLQYALSTHWYALNLFSDRYKFYKRSIKYLLGGLISFLISIIIFLAAYSLS